MPLTTFSRVDLPEPLRLMIATAWPSSMRALTLSEHFVLAGAFAEGAT